MIHYPTLKLIFDRHKRASSTKEGAIELRITHQRQQRFATTGIRVLPKQWRDGRIVNRLDALELQQALDAFVLNAQRIIQDKVQSGTLNMATIVADINGRAALMATMHTPQGRLVIDYMRERAEVRKYGRAEDSRERYDRFLRWFESWGQIRTFADITEANIMRMDEALSRKGMKDCSKWGNYHRFLNSFILDAMDDGLMQRNPYKHVHIKKDKNSDTAIEKYLTQGEFSRLASLEPTTEYLRHARDLFVFQTYTCLAYVDLAAFDPAKIRDIGGRKMYVGRRGKTRQEYTFLLLPQALAILERYGYKLPIMSNQKYNEYIKVLAVMAGIDKPVSSHWARHTGATMLLNSGVGMEVVSKVLGHSTTRITRQIYAKLLDETIAEEMSKMI